MLRSLRWIAVILLVGVVAWMIGRTQTPAPVADPVSEIASGFAGVDACRGCHPAETKAWEMSPHGRHAIPVATPDGGSDGAVGSRWMQAYLRRDAIGFHRIVPTCFDLTTKKWRDVESVLDEIRGPKAPEEAHQPKSKIEDISFELSCSGCHASGSSFVFDIEARRMRSTWRSLAIDCEACHGPGREHGEAWERNDPVALARLEKLPARASTALCARCHGGPAVSPAFSVDDAIDFIGLQRGLHSKFAHGASSGHIYQHEAFLRSPCHREGGLTCADCHDPHGPGMRPAPHVDAMCTRCHEDRATRAHTHHDITGDGARCVSCHMPRLLGGMIANRRDHRISSPLPAAAEAPDACTTCHQDRDKAWAEEAYRTWWGDPPRPTVDAIGLVHRARSGDVDGPALRKLLMHDDPFFRIAAAQMLNEWATLYDDLVPELRLFAIQRDRAGDRPARLREALDDPEVRIRAAAIVALDALGRRARAEDMADLGAAVRHDRDAPALHVLLGLLELEHGEAALALTRFEQVIVFHPDHLHAWLGLAAAQAALGRSAVATRAFATMRLNWAEPNEMDGLVDAQMSAGRVRAARLLLEACARHAPQPARVRAVQMLRALIARGPKEGS